MMDRVRSSRSTSGGVGVAHRGVAKRLQLTLSADLMYAKSSRTYIRTTLPTLSDGGGDEERKCFEK